MTYWKLMIMDSAPMLSFRFKIYFRESMYSGFEYK